MTRISPITGSGGGGKGGGSTHVPSEAPNTLRSRAVARVVDLLCEGPIKGLVNGAQSVFYDDTPLEDADGNPNFRGVSYTFRDGTPDQDYMPGFSEVESEVPLGIEVTAAAPVVRTITSSTADAVRVTIRIPALAYQDPENGDLRGSKVEFLIEARAEGGAWQRVDAGYRWESFTGATQSDATGVKVTVEGTTNGGVYKETLALGAEYRAQGGVWVPLGRRDIDVVNGVYYGLGEGRERTYLPTRATATFSIAGLSPGVYEVRATDGAVAQSFEYVPAPLTIDGKCTSPYDVAYRLPLPAGGPPWDIRVTRLTPDSEKSNLRNQTYWASYTEITEAKMTYRNSAVIGHAVDAETFGGSIPRRAFEIDGLIVSVPSNYDPYTRTYTGLWDGTFKQDWTDNPAWVLYAILTEPRWGLGDAVDPSVVDKWALYEIAQYCDEPVDDGYGGQEPRFRLNAVIHTREDAYKVVQAVASAFRGMAFWTTGAVAAIADKPADAVKLAAPADVIGGQFNYEGSALKARHTVAHVVWNDPGDNYRPAIEVVEDLDGIERYGFNQVDVAAYGCTSRGQARRLGKWILDSERAETEAVTYQASWDHADVAPGDVIHIADPSYMGVRRGGRVKSATTTSVELDAPVTLAEGEIYTLSVVMPDQSIEQAGVTNGAGEHTTLTLDSALSQAPEPFAMWALSGSDAAPRPFRVQAVTETQDHIFEVRALFHDATKYARVERGISFEPPRFSTVPTGPLRAPTNLSTDEYLYRAGPAIKAAVTLSWTPADDPRALYYEVQKRPPDQNWRPAGTEGTASIDIEDVTEGLWGFRVRAVDSLGRKSVWATLENALLAEKAPPPNVTGFEIEVVDAMATLTWGAVSVLDLSHYQVRFAPVTTGVTWGSAAVLKKRVTGETVQVPAMVGTYLVKAIDLSGVESEAAALVTTTVAGVAGLNVVETVTEDPAFGGAKTRVVLDGSLGGLRLDYARDVFANADWFEHADWFLGDTGLEADGVYEFDGPDLGAVYTSRLTATLDASGVNLASDFFAVQDVFAQTDFFGLDPSAWGVELQVCTTNDDPGGTPAWGPWRTFVVGDYTARGFQFRALVSASEYGMTPLISGLSVSIDMPDRVDGAEDVVCPAGGMRVTFDPAFRAVKGLGIAAQDMQPGDRYAISNKGPDGFDIEFFDDTGASVSRTFDHIEKGYGRVTK